MLSSTDDDHFHKAFRWNKQCFLLFEYHIHLIYFSLRLSQILNS